MIRTTYFGGIGSTVDPDDDDHVFGVVRYPQDFVGRVTDRNIPALAPPSDLLDAFKAVEEAAERDGVARPAEVAWNTVSFEPRYLAYLTRPGPQDVLDELREAARDRDVWLVCWEKDCRWCHRRLLANELVADLEGVEIAHHPDPTTLEQPTASTDDGPANASLDAFQEGST